MPRELITHVFSSLQSLERCAAENKAAFFVVEPQNTAKAKELGEHEKVLKHMRRVANLIQIESAKKNFNSLLRLLEIYYGLHSMVRPEVVSTYAARLGSQKSPIEDRAVFH